MNNIVEIKIDDELMTKLERAYYMEQSTKLLYLEAIDRGMDCSGIMEDVIKAAIELDVVKDAVTQIANTTSNSVRWSANFIKRCIEVTVNDNTPRVV
jgi:hypothetical protein